jgi:hypothetical protein
MVYACAAARHIATALWCTVWLAFATGCQTSVGVERVDAATAQRQLTANALTADELSPSARNVLRRWVLSERYDEDPAGAIAALHGNADCPRVHAHSIIAVAGNGPVEGSDDGVVEYSSSDLDGVDSEYIVRSTHSTQSNPYTIEEVRRILLLHAADVCRRIPCGHSRHHPALGRRP